LKEILWIKDLNGQILIKKEQYAYLHVVLVLSSRPKESSSTEVEMKRPTPVKAKKPGMAYTFLLMMM
jgi:hypothetical protein